MDSFIIYSKNINKKLNGEKMNKKALTIILMTFGSAALFSYAVTNLMIKLAMDREIPAYLQNNRTRLPEGKELKKFFDSITETSEKLKSK